MTPVPSGTARDRSRTEEELKSITSNPARDTPRSHDIGKGKFKMAHTYEQICSLQIRRNGFWRWCGWNACRLSWYTAERYKRQPNEETCFGSVVLRAPINCKSRWATLPTWCSSIFLLTLICVCVSLPCTLGFWKWMDFGMEYVLCFHLVWFSDNDCVIFHPGCHFALYVSLLCAPCLSWWYMYANVSLNTSRWCITKSSGQIHLPMFVS